MRHAIHVLIRTAGFVFAGAALGAIVLVVWLLASPSGARFALAHLPGLIALDLRVGAFEGRLAGPLEVRDFELHLPTVDITIDRARVEWMPSALLERNVHVDALAAGHIVVKVHPRVPPQPPSDEPASFPQIPIGIILGHARVDELRLQVAPDQPEQVVSRIVIDASRWVGPDVEIQHLAADHSMTGPLEASLVGSMGHVAAAVQTLKVKATGGNGAEVHAKGRVRLDGHPSDLALDWKNLRWPLVLEAGATPAVASREGAVSVKGTLDDARAEGRFALGDTAMIQGRGRYTPKALEAHLAWTKLAWPIFGPPRVASASGTIDVTGKPDAYRYRLDGALAAEGYAGLAKASGHGTLADVTLEALHLAVGDATVEGAAHVAWEPAVTIDADVAVANVDPGLISPDWPGSLNGHVKAVTSVEGHVARSTFTVALDQSRLRDRPFALDAAGDLQGEQVTLSSFELRAGATKVTGKGRVTPPFDASAQLDSPDLAALWPGLAGELSMRASIAGPLDTLRVQTAGAGKRLSYARVALDAARFDADVHLDGAWRADVEADGLHAPVEITRAKLVVEGSASAHDLSAKVEAPQGTVELGAHGAFDRHAIAWNGAVTTGTITFGTLTPWTLEDTAPLQVSRATIALQPACWRNAGSRACTQVTHTGARLRTAFRLENIDYAWFAPLLPTGWTVSGGVGGTGVVQFDDGHLSDARADLAFAPSRIERDGETLLQTLDGTAAAFHDRGTVKGQLHLPIQGGHVDLQGQIGDAADPLQRPLDARLDVLIEDLAFLRLASPEIVRAAGRIEGMLRWSGTTGAPRADGTIALTGGAFRLGRPGIDLEKVEAHLAAADSGTLDVDASATSGDGTMSVKGRANLLGAEKGVQLRIVGDKFQAANTAELRATISPDLKVSIKGRKVDVSGTLTVPKASITPITFDSGIAPTSDQRIVRQGGEADADTGMTLTADVKLVLGSKVHFEGFGLKTDLTGSVRAIEQPGRPGSGRGEVRLEGGRYKAYGQDLEIQQGRLLFNGGPLTEPGLEIRAVRKPADEIEIDVLVRGTLAKPLFQVTSIPPMPRERQLAWLVLGHDLESTNSGDERAMLANAALSLGLTGTDFIAQNLRGRLGIDEISIGADSGDEADQARFTIGKYLSPKLYVSYGVGIFQPGNVFKLLYDLGHGFKLSTESGVVTGGDLLYTVETGKPDKTPAKVETAVPEAGR